MVRAAFLDRDGVLNRAICRAGKPYPPATMEEFEILPGVKQALQLLKGVGFLTVVVTNQPDVRTGKQSLERVREFHAYLRSELPIDDIRVCYHIDSDGCHCRKPKPGMLIEAAKVLDIDLAESYMVGDRWRDVLAGQRAGCRSILIGDGYSEIAGNLNDSNYFTAVSLLEAARTITQETRTANAALSRGAT